MQTCIMEAMAAKEASGAKYPDCLESFKLVCRRGIGATCAALMLCARKPGGGPSLFVVPRASAEQTRRAMQSISPASAGARHASWAAVTTTSELEGWAKSVSEGLFAPDGVVVVTDSFYKRLALIAPADTVFSRAVFDDAYALDIPGCPRPRARAAWAVVGYEMVYGEPGRRGFLGGLLKTEPSGNAVWCSECAVTADHETAKRMFRAPYGPPVDRLVVAWRPDSPAETASIVLEKSSEDPRGASGLIGCVDTRVEGWKGWKESGDRCCPVCLAEPAEAAAERGARLRVRTRCCGKEFCAECLSSALVARAEMGLAPSCPQCRDCLGACLEACDPVLVDEAGEPVAGASGALVGVKTFEETIAGLVRDALACAGSRVVVVVSPHAAGSARHDAWIRRACGGPDGARGFERLTGTARDMRGALSRFEAGTSRVLVVESGPRKEYGLRMPWVTHVVMTDCFSRSSHWVMRTSASHIESSLRKRSSPAGGGCPPPLKVRRMVPARYVLGRAL